MGSPSTFGVTWHVALRLGRVSNLPTVWTNVLAGIVLSGAAVTVTTLAGLMLALSMFYVAGMYLNDAFDARFDRVNRPSRPIPSGDVAASTVFGIGGGLIAAALGLIFAVAQADGGSGVRGLAAGLALTAAILVYDAWHKSNPIGPLLMGACRVLVYVTAAITVSGAVPSGLLWAAATTLSYLIGLTYAAKQEDLLRPGHLWPLAFLTAPALYGLPVAEGSLVGLLIYIAFVAAVISALSIMRRGRSEIGRAVAVLIAGISLVDGLFIAGNGEPVLAASTIAAFALTLALQRHVPGT